MLGALPIDEERVLVEPLRRVWTWGVRFDVEVLNGRKLEAL
jgi:hypothetical protein